MTSVFTRIIKGEIPGHILYENDLTMAILTIRPHTPGHTLILSKKEVDHLYQLPPVDYQAMFTTAQKLAPLLQEITQADRIGYLVAGFEVPHAHLHLIPANSSQDLEESAASDASQEDLKTMKVRIQELLQSSS